jgi:hypothetical protein
MTWRVELSTVNIPLLPDDEQMLVMNHGGPLENSPAPPPYGAGPNLWETSRLRPLSWMAALQKKRKDSEPWSRAVTLGKQNTRILSHRAESGRHSKKNLCIHYIYGAEWPLWEKNVRILKTR